MKRTELNSNLLHTILRVDRKCDIIICKLNAICDTGEDRLIKAMRKSAKSLYENSLEERNRDCVTMRIFRHGR